MRFHNPNKKERQALRSLWCQDQQGMSYRQFYRTAVWSGMNRCIFVRWCGMVVGIESDGHRHT